MGHPQGDSSSFLLLYIFPYPTTYHITAMWQLLLSFSRKVLVLTFFNSKKNVIARVKRKRILFIIEICAKKRRFVKRIEKRAFLRRKISHEKFGCYSIFSYLCKRDAKASIRTTALRCNCKVDTHELRKLIRSIILQGCPIE